MTTNLPPCCYAPSPAGNLRLQLYEYKAGFSSADRPPGHSANTPFHAYSSWQVRRSIQRQTLCISAMLKTKLDVPPA